MNAGGRLGVPVWAVLVAVLASGFTGGRPGPGAAPGPAAASVLDGGVIWEVLEPGGGTVDAAGRYTAPGTPGTYHLRATSRAEPTRSAVVAVEVTATCWRLLPLDRVRVIAAPGASTAMVGGKIQGSTESATNAFVDLFTIDAAPSPNPAVTELVFANGIPYRFLRYWGPAGSHGQVAELEFLSGSTRLRGAGFGTVGTRSGNPWQNALDGDPATFFDGLLESDVYVGIDVASGHQVAAPTFSPPDGSYTGPQSITVSSATPGTSIRYTLDGSDPLAGGIAYAGPVEISRTGILRAAAAKDCMAASSSSAVYQIGASAESAQSSIHIGNSLTDSIEPYLRPLASAAGITLDWWRYTIPGIGTYVYADNPTGGNGLESAPTQDVRVFLRSRPFGHVAFQPAANMPCVPTGHASESPAAWRSDAVNVAEAWDDAWARNASVQLWIYATWPAPAEPANCMSGSWNRDPLLWNPPRATTWDEGVALMLEYDERVRADLARLHPERPAPRVVPAGLALQRLKARVEAGAVPGIGTGDFFAAVFQAGLSADDHLTPGGRYLVSLVHFAVLFQRSPVGLPHPGTGLTDAQAAVFQQVAWETAQGYAWSGLSR